MKYNFDQIVDRRSINSMKWNVAENELPLWVADMDFDTAPEIKAAVMERAQLGAYGYAETNGAWEQAYCNWWKNRYNFEISPEWLVFSTGVVPTISSTVRKITTPGENVLLLTPTYNIFYNSILNNGRNPVECQLKYSGESYEIDFEDLEEKLQNKQTSLMILCNPQNPVGKIWQKAELARIGELCAKNNVVVLSDEIHCDITEPGKLYVPFASVNETCRNNCIMAVAPTKTFNLAGLGTAAVVVPNENLRHKVWRGLNTDECGEPNAFAVQAVVSAFSKGKDWLEELREYVWQNRRLVEKFVESEIPCIKAIKSDATYLVWLDVSKTGLDGNDFAEKLRSETGLVLSEGNQYGKGGESFVRMNLATSKTVVEDALSRLKKFCSGF
ncbi:MAG: pyridoxal phosphate-dependent aminotransferase [Treponema sp.]|nr:pyridoxal phosphate-dependent aminotransferase [Candidatus Treponema equifaecale]